MNSLGLYQRPFTVKCDTVGGTDYIYTDPSIFWFVPLEELLRPTKCMKDKRMCFSVLCKSQLFFALTIYLSNYAISLQGINFIVTITNFVQILQQCCHI